MGKSATGKDTIYRELFEKNRSNLKKIIPYTTRPIRDGEIEGEAYHFCDEAQVEAFLAEGKIIELRAYDTVYGIWKYFTADDGQFDLETGNYLLIGTLEVYEQLVKYFAEGCVVPVYIEVEDGERLMRAIAREKQQATQKYEEMCRRFLADAKDFSEERLAECGIYKRFVNHSIEETVTEILSFMESQL